MDLSWMDTDQKNSFATLI